jgi:hypothetical protein
MPIVSSKRVFIPEVVEPDEKLPADLVALRRFAYLMDEAVAIPGTRFRVGIDAAIGLIPGFGDVAGGLLSTWIIIGALRHRVPTSKVLRMLFNVLGDIVVGSVPLIGDLIDFLFEENVINLNLLLRHRDRKRPPRRMGEIALSAVLIVCVVLAVAMIPVAVLIVLAVWIAGKR